MSISVQIEKKLGDFTLNVAFEAGNEVLALLGASGCGKSLTLRCISGIERPDRGRIVVDGQTLFDSERRIDLPPQKRQVGLLFQNYALFPTMTVAQNIAAALPRRERGQVADWLRRFRLEDQAHLLPAQLSGGQQQRTALARMLITRPRLLMLDEPFSALDTHLRQELEQEVQEVTRSFGGTTLLVTHDRDEAYRFARSIAVCHQGRICRQDEKEALFHDPQTVAAARITGCRNIAAAHWQDGQVSVPQWGLTLAAPAPVHPADHVGVRSHTLQGAAEQGENVFPYEVVSVTEDAFSVTLMIRPQGCPQAQPICWALSRREYAALPPGGLVHIPPEALLPLQNS